MSRDVKVGAAPLVGVGRAGVVGGQRGGLVAFVAIEQFAQRKVP